VPERPDDFALLSRWAAGDRAAGADLVERYFDPLYRFFRSRTPQGDQGHGDLVQETLRVCLESSVFAPSGSDFRAFLFGIARNVALAHQNPPGRASVTAPPPELRTLMTRVPFERQIVLQLVYWQGFSPSELADVLGVTIEVARSKIRDAATSLNALAAEAGLGCELSLEP